MLTLWLAVMGPAFGDTLVVPNNQTTAPGTVPLAFPGTPFRFQEVVGSGQFTAPIVITGIRLRAAPGSGAVSANYSSYKVTLSTTQLYPNTAHGQSAAGEHDRMDQFRRCGWATTSFLSAGPGDRQPQVSTGNLKGTYTLNKDGTGSVKLAAGGVAAGTFAFVVVDGGSGLMLLLTDGTTSNVFSGTARLQ